MCSLWCTNAPSEKYLAVNRILRRRHILSTYRDSHPTCDPVEPIVGVHVWLFMPCQVSGLACPHTPLLTYWYFLADIPLVLILAFTYLMILSTLLRIIYRNSHCVHPGKFSRSAFYCKGDNMVGIFASKVRHDVITVHQPSPCVSTKHHWVRMSHLPLRSTAWSGMLWWRQFSVKM